MPQPNIVWLVSYPYCGNDLFKSFFTALLEKNEPIKTKIFPSTDIFKFYTDLDPGYLYDEEVSLLLPAVYTALSNEAETTTFIETDDAYTKNASGLPIFPPAITKAALYIVRNPLDIVALYSNNLSSTIDDAIDAMSTSFRSKTDQRNTYSPFKLPMLSWSEHVQSWVKQTFFPVHVIRYEDLIRDPVSTVLAIVKNLELEIKEKDITGLIDCIGFRNYAKRSATVTKQQAQSILDHHSEVMKEYGYNINLNEYSIR